MESVNILRSPLNSHYMEAITEDFEKNLQIAMETKGYATPADLRPIPISEFLRRLSGSKSHAGAGGDD